MEYMVRFRLFQTTNHMPATSLLKNCELDETYYRVTITISAEAKFLTVLMATFRDNKAQYWICMFLQLPIHRKPALL